MGEQPFATKGDYAYARVRELILSGQAEPGSALNQETLAATIGISTTPLREALRRLKSEGWVTLDAHSNARVSDLSATEARDLYELRHSLDPLAARLAAQRRDAADIERMEAAAENLRPVIGGAGEEVLVAHREFHASLYRASRNDMLIQLLDGLWDKADRYRRFGLVVLGDPSDQRLQDYEEHFTLMQAVIRGQDELAEAVMRHHVQTSLGAQAVRRLSE